MVQKNYLVLRKKCSEYDKINRINRNKYFRNRYNIEEIKNKQIIRVTTIRFIKISKISQCAECGSKTNLHRHHPDYNKPMEVIILCRKCHNLLHNIMV